MGLLLTFTSPSTTAAGWMKAVLGTVGFLNTCGKAENCEPPTVINRLTLKEDNANME